MPNQQTMFLSRLDYLEKQLRSESGFDNEVKEAIPQMWLPLIKDDTLKMLLTNLPVENAEDAKRILCYYLRKWECEEAIRFLKSQVHLERIRTFCWCAIRRLVLLAAVVIIYIGWIIEKHLELAERLISFDQPSPSQADFLPFRLLRGMTKALNGCFWLRRDLLEIREKSSKYEQNRP